MSKKRTSEVVRQIINKVKGGPENNRVKIWFLLDRSGSMELLAADVIGGFNQYVNDQAGSPRKARLTAVQFDGDNAFEVICDARLIDDVPKLTSSIYVPRGMTPLYDAVGELIRTADQRLVARSERNEPKEDQLVIVFTDGCENASRNFDRTQVFDLINDRTDAGWTFVFMGANQDSYAEGRKIGMNDGNVQNYEASPESVEKAFASLSRASLEYQANPSYMRSEIEYSFFGGVKEAEDA